MDDVIWCECGDCSAYFEGIGANELEECPECGSTDLTTSDFLGLLPED